ncbi:MAG TPA: MotA/TolQ/ExbB proton channel family protein [Bacteroidota bacterium]|nr:MotA/TolQ/ExbB proton channel family protein [Bacteroidota bacterium]
MKRSMDIGMAAGLLFGVLSIFGSFLLEGGQVGALFLVPAMTIVFGGTFAAAMIGTPLKVFGKIGTIVRIALFPPQFDVRSAMAQIVRFSSIARKEGLLVLERESGKIEDPFMEKMLRFLIDGADPEVLRGVGEAETEYVTQRHGQYIAIFQRMGGYSPTMGIIGTVMGLIATLASAGADPNTLIKHIGSAFIATLWGVFMANIVWLPVADRLKNINSAERFYMEMITEGILEIQSGEVPTVIKAKLNSMLAKSEQVAE